MINLKYHLNVKIILLVFSAMIIVAVFSINRYMINELRNEVKNEVSLLAKAYSKAINSNNEDDLEFVMEVLLPSLTFPLVITSNDEISITMNIKSSNIDKEIWKIVNDMDRDFMPLALIWDDIQWGHIHYSDPLIISRIQWLPYIELSLGIMFLLVFIFCIRIIQNSEKNFIYAGMAKETAHQLGTPISSLMGWVDLLKQEYKNNTITKSIDEDLNRLSEISDKFSKIGSKPKFKNINLYNCIKKTEKYIQKRLPSRSKINLSLTGSNKIMIEGDSILLGWAFENLYKNSIEAIGQNIGYIKINIIKNNEKIIIDFTDSGRGVLRKNWHNIFKPGYSSKRRGWGIGLNLAKRIVNEIHSGTIQINNSNSQGTTFRLTFNI